MNDDVVKKLLSPQELNYEEVEKILRAISIDEFPLVIEKLASEKKRFDEKNRRGIEYWKDTARSNSHSMDGYCDNEANASSRGREENKARITRVVRMTMAVWAKRERKSAI